MACKRSSGAYSGTVALVNVQDVKLGMKVVQMSGHMPAEAGYLF
jgi:hypothetical protein